MIWLIVLLLLFIVQIATVLISEFRRPSKTVAWLTIIFMFPIFGFVMYYFLAAEYRQRRKVRRRGFRGLKEIGKLLRKRASTVQELNEFTNSAMRQERRLFGLLYNMPEAPITARNRTKVFTDAGPLYEDMLQAIEAAKHHIHFEFYIFRSDRIGRRFQEALIRKAEEGVEVRVIYDGVGSYKTKAEFWRRLEQAGIELQAFLPPVIALLDKRINYRNHRKILVVDGLVGFVGGVNIGDEYLGADPKLGYWRDRHLRLEGDSVYMLQQTFLTDWKFTGGSIPGALDSYMPEHCCTHSESVQIVVSGPDEHEDAIMEMVFAAITSAKERVWVVTPYFIPDASVLMALKTAALSGADVRIIIPGVGDSPLALFASLSYVEELLEAGARVYRYQKGFNHAKAFVVDHMVASTGTANLDMRSFFSNFEVNAVLFDVEAIAQLAAAIEQDLEDSREIVLSEFKRRGRLQRLKESGARLLSPLL
ncbi:cardiolipin synthase [Paenibacillus turpanensis]|uniref:cardiolipin synthase n=1 Tax=Paenibacillus turpanensis TaxID=2689078 RepID=UPI00140DAE91|nr:cardiolipin synthase [Paenibacillus turpanensis]